MKSSPRCDVLVIDPEPVARLGMITLLKSHARLRVAGEAETVRTGRELCAKLKPDIVVIDPAMEGGEGFVLLKDVPRWAPRARVVAFSAIEDAFFVQRAFSAGACGYVTRRDPVPALISAVLGAASGERHVSPRIEKVLLDHLAAGSPAANHGALGKLSERELQVFHLLGEGHATRVVSERLGVSVKTVESHQQRIKSKLCVGSGAELRKRAALFVAGRGA
ncbi:MAG: response regulator transcription factor [Chthoniobacteraceae bacterium]